MDTTQQYVITEPPVNIHNVEKKIQAIESTKTAEYQLTLMGLLALFFFITSVYLEMYSLVSIILISIRWEILGINIEDADAKDMIDSQREALKGNEYMLKVYGDQPVEVLIQSKTVKLDNHTSSQSPKEPRGFGKLKGGITKSEWQTGTATVKFPAYNPKQTISVSVSDDTSESVFDIRMYKTKLQYDEDKADIWRLTSIDISRAVIQDIPSLVQVIPHYGDHWRGPIDEKATSFSSKNRELEVKVYPAGGPFPIEFPAFTGNWRIFLGLALCGVALILLIVVWTMRLIYGGFTFGTLEPPAWLYSSRLKFRGW